jgi:hypothetical protein
MHIVWLNPIVVHIHLMLVNSHETLYLNLAMQLVGSQHAHSNEVHGCQNLCNLDYSAMSN